MGYASELVPDISDELEIGILEAVRFKQFGNAHRFGNNEA